MKHFIIVLGLILVTSARVWAGPKGLPEPIIPQNLGVNIHFTDPKPGEMDMLAKGGFGFVRMDMLWNQSWSSTERVKGVYDFSAYDRLLAQLEPRNIRIVMILAYGNSLYDGGLSPHTDEGRRAFANWAVAAAKHFAGRGIIWEIWNEPNGRLFWKPTPKAEDYAQLAVTAAKAIHEALPDEIVVGPALAKMDWPFIETCFKAGVLEYWSAVTVHPYRDSAPETVAEDYRKLRRMIAQYAPEGKKIPIISGEWGYFLTLGPKTTPEQQGKMLARQWLTNLANDIPLSIWYDWHDDGQNPKDVEHHLGTVFFEYHKDRPMVYDPKPTYFAAKTLTTLLHGYRFNKPLLIASDEDHVLLFNKGADVCVVAWTHGQPHDLVIPASTGKFTVTSLTGEQLPELTADAKGLTIHLTDSPQYLIPQTPNDLLNLAAAWERLPLDVMTTGPRNLEIKAPLRNVTGHAIRVKSSTGQTLDIAPGETGAFTLTQAVLRSDVRELLRLELEIEGMGHLAQETRIVVTNMLNPVLQPVGSQMILAQIDNPSGQAFAGTISMAVKNTAEGPGGSAPLEIKTGETSKMIEIKTQQPLPETAFLLITMTNPQGQVVASTKVSYSSAPAEGLGKNAYGIWPMKDQSFTPGEAPVAPPTRRGPVMKLDYQFTAAVKPPATQATTQATATQAATQAATKPAAPVVTLSITPKPKQDQVKLIRGKPKALVLWVYGDGSGDNMCARFTDSTGQTFQPLAAPITWQGWRSVVFPLDDPAVWHWGGAQEEVIHYPIEWHTLFLLDAPKKQSNISGTIYLASPTVIWEEP